MNTVDKLFNDLVEALAGEGEDKLQLCVTVLRDLRRADNTDAIAKITGEFILFMNTRH